MTDRVPVCAMTGAVLRPGAPLWWMYVKDFGYDFHAEGLLQPGVSLGTHRAFAPVPDPDGMRITASLQLRDPFDVETLANQGITTRADGRRCAVIAPAVADACVAHYRVAELGEAHLDTLRWSSGQSWAGLTQDRPGFDRGGPWERRAVPYDLWCALLPIINGSLGVNLTPTLHGDADARMALWRTLAVLRAATRFGVFGRLPFLGQYVGKLDEEEHADREGAFAMLARARAEHEAHPPPPPAAVRLTLQIPRPERVTFEPVGGTPIWWCNLGLGYALTLRPVGSHGDPMVTIRLHGRDIAEVRTHGCTGAWQAGRPPPLAVVARALEVFRSHLEAEQRDPTYRQPL